MTREGQKVIFSPGRPLEIDAESEALTHLLNLMHALAEDELKQSGKTTREILVVEDNDNNSALVEDILDSIGMQGHVVTNATDAIEYCKKNTPIMILMDIGLPEMDGLELTAKLREWPSMQNVPCIAVTAHAGPRMQDRASEAGCDDFLAKPYSPNQLIDVIDRHSKNQPVMS